MGVSGEGVGGVGGHQHQPLQQAEPMVANPESRSKDVPSPNPPSHRPTGDGHGTKMSDYDRGRNPTDYLITCG